MSDDQKKIDKGLTLGVAGELLGRIEQNKQRIETTKSQYEVIVNEMHHISRSLESFKETIDKMDTRYVNQREFDLWEQNFKLSLKALSQKYKIIQMLVFGGVGAVLLGVLGVILDIVLKR